MGILNYVPVFIKFGEEGLFVLRQNHLACLNFLTYKATLEILDLQTYWVLLNIIVPTYILSLLLVLTSEAENWILGCLIMDFSL